MEKALSNERAAMQKTLDNRFEQLINKINTRLATTPQGKTELPRLLGPPGNGTSSKPLVIASNR